MSQNRRRTVAGGRLQGPRPSPLVVEKNSHQSHVKKSSSGPVIVYLRSPEVLHVPPHEFMGLVQRLTGNQACPAASLSCSNSVSYSSSHGGAAMEGGGGDINLEITSISRQGGQDSYFHSDQAVAYFENGSSILAHEFHGSNISPASSVDWPKLWQEYE